MTTGSDPRPWRGLYPPGTPDEVTAPAESVLDMFRATVTRAPSAAAVRYFGTTISYAELDRYSDAFAPGLLASGHQAGDRVALYLQNIPQYLIAQLGAWKADGVAVAINPMNRERELTELLVDSGATTLVTLSSLHQAVEGVLGELGLRCVITTDEAAYATWPDDRLLPAATPPRPAGTLDFGELLNRHERARPPVVSPRGSDLAVLTYTSGTTGPPKGAMTTHAAIVLGAETYRLLTDLGPDDRILAVAPLFHVTGLTGHIALSLLVGAPLVMTDRFAADAVLEVMAAEGVTFTIGSITVFMALLEAAVRRATTLPALRQVLSGGAPVAPAAVRRFEEHFGLYLRNVYGLTETTYPTHAVPAGRRAPLDPASGALSVGLPVPGALPRVLDDRGAEVGIGEVGELVVRSAQLAAGYWNKPEQTAAAFPDREFHTGDVGFMDAQGWFYVVDRLKDQINAGGYKVWPREVEDVLYEHPAVREAAVVGVPDDYRGETVKAFVTLRAGQVVGPDELVEFCRARMAAYKYPRVVEFLDDIPKTASGKILRRRLRDDTPPPG